MTDVDVDLLVVGAGPTGLYAAVYAGLRGLSCAVVDSLEQPGGQVAALYPEKLLFDVAGFPAVRGRDLVAGLVEQAGAYGTRYLLGQTAVRLDRTGRPLVVGTSAGLRVGSGAVVVTGGIGTFTPRPLPGCEGFSGAGLAYTVPDPAAHAGRDVLVVGGGDSAVDWALTLEPVARSVTLVHRRARFRAHAASVAALHASTVDVRTDAQVRALLGDPDVRAAVVEDPSGTRELPCQAVVAALGFHADLGPLEAWGLEVVDRRLVVDTQMATALPGVYAAGDITDYRGKVRLISVGFGEAATAVNNAATWLDPDAPLFPGHSTDAAPVPVGV